jgi:hypothetical protein
MFMLSSQHISLCRSIRYKSRRLAGNADADIVDSIFSSQLETVELAALLGNHHKL